MATSEELAILIRAQNLTQQAFDKARKDLENLGNQSQKTNQLGKILQSTIGKFTIAGVAANAISSLAASVGDFAKEGLKLPALQYSFENLTSGLKLNGDQMLANMRDATQGMVSNIDLMQTANKAMLLGLPVTTQSMGELAQAATSLGRAMGQDATKSLDDLITALGRSSPMILDNLGLSVKVGEANEVYAAKLGKTAEALTDAERKMAFYEAAMEAARKKSTELGEQTPTAVERMKSAWTSIGNVITAEAARINKELGQQLDLLGNINLELEARAGISFDRSVKAPKAPSAPGFLFTPPGIAAVNESEAALEMHTNALNAQRRALDDAAKAADKHAQTIKELRDEMFGRSAITAANDYLQAIGSINNLSNVSEDGQRRLNAAAAEAIDAYKRLGQTAPAALNELYIRTIRLPEATRGIADVISDLGREAQISIPKLYDLPKPVELTGDEIELLGRKSSLTMKDLIPAAAKTSEVSINDLSRAISQMATVADGAFGEVVRDLGSIVTAAATAKESIDLMKDSTKAEGKLDAIVAMTSGILGIISAAVQAGKAIANLFDRNKGRDLVVDFADTFGGFDQLHEKLLELGDEGERLWIKLTQGVGRNNPQQAQAAIEEVSAALDKQAQKQDEAQVATEAGALATIETATQASAALDTVNDKLEGNKAAWEEWSDSVMRAIAAVAGSLGGLAIPAPSGGAVPGFAGGTHGAYLDFGAGTPVMLHGRERVMTEAEGRRSAGGWLGTTVINIDGREVARASTRYQRQVLAPYGVR